MAKLKIKQWSNVGDILTSEELKHVCGGVGSGNNGSGCPTGGVAGSGESWEACRGKKWGDPCSFIAPIPYQAKRKTYYGNCHFDMYCVFYCSLLNQ